MVRKKVEGKKGVYCGAEAMTSDHTLARKFFLEKRRGDLPQVPACFNCNNRKSELERYLMTILAFGAKHSDALENLATLVPPRLEKNAKLSRQLRSGLLKSGGKALPLDYKQLEEYLGMLAKALAYQHYGLILSEGFGSIGSVFHDSSEAALDRMFSGMCNQVHGDLGNGTFTYVGSQHPDLPELTLWRFQLYGKIDFKDPRFPGHGSLLTGITGPLEKIRSLQSLSEGRAAPRSKVGRNEECPCGSGKKFKKCHGLPEGGPKS